MRELSKEEIEKFRKNNNLTLGVLKDFMDKYNIPSDALVMVERVEDVYFEGCDISGMRGCPDTPDGIFPEGSKSTEWGVYLVKDLNYGSALHWNKCIDEPEKYPGMVGKTKLTDEELKLSMNQFHPAWSCSYMEEDNILLIHVHY